MTLVWFPGALKQLFSSITLENPFTPYITTSQTGSATSTVTSTHDPNVNATSSKTSTYITDLLTEVMRITDPEQVDEKQLRQKLSELVARKQIPDQYPATDAETTTGTVSSVETSSLSSPLGKND